MENKEFGFNLEVISATPEPNKLIYLGLHTCYSADRYVDMKIPDELECGKIAIDRLLKGGRGHWSPTELPSITFRFENFPHSVLQQARTHRIGVSFSVQSFRYCSEHLIKAAEDITKLEKVIYIPPAGLYKDRQGNNYDYTPEKRNEDRALAFYSLKHYAKRVSEGMPPEIARGRLVFDYRQHFVISFNCRSLMHFLDLRSKKDAQLEIIIMSEMIMEEFIKWNPVIAEYYLEHRWGKALLSP